MRRENFQRVNLANDNGRVDLHCNRDPAAAVLIAENALSTGMPGFIDDRCQGDRAARRYRNLDWGESRSDLCMRRSFRSVQTVRKSLRLVDVNRPRMTIVGDGVRDQCSASRDLPAPSDAVSRMSRIAGEREPARGSARLLLVGRGGARDIQHGGAR
jgi:hypothetical protein